MDLLSPITLNQPPPVINFNAQDIPNLDMLDDIFMDDIGFEIHEPEPSMISNVVDFVVENHDLLSALILGFFGIASLYRTYNRVFLLIF